jgi:hypothetical protein
MWPASAWFHSSNALYSSGILSHRFPSHSEELLVQPTFGIAHWARKGISWLADEERREAFRDNGEPSFHRYSNGYGIARKPFKTVEKMESVSRIVQATLERKTSRKMANSALFLLAELDGQSRL